MIIFWVGRHRDSSTWLTVTDSATDSPLRAVTVVWWHWWVLRMKVWMMAGAWWAVVVTGWRRTRRRRYVRSGRVAPWTQTWPWWGEWHRPRTWSHCTSLPNPPRSANKHHDSAKKKKIISYFFSVKAKRRFINFIFLCKKNYKKQLPGYYTLTIIFHKHSKKTK